MATETLAHGARGQGWRGWFLNSTERCPSRCLCVKVHHRARRLKFLCLGICPVYQIRGAKNQRLRLDLKLEEILHSTCRAPVWLVGVKLVEPEGGMFDLVKYYGDSDSGPLRGCGVDVDKS